MFFNFAPQPPAETEPEARPLHIPIPFLAHEIGLGDAIASATAAAGVKPCAPCKKRAAALNDRIVFNPWST